MKTKKRKIHPWRRMGMIACEKSEHTKATRKKSYGYDLDYRGDRPNKGMLGIKLGDGR